MEYTYTDSKQTNKEKKTLVIRAVEIAIKICEAKNGEIDV